LATLIQQRSPTFSGFGNSILVQQTRARLARHRIPQDRLQARAMLHDHCPLTPGVYGWLDNNQQICYIGKSKSLRQRLLTYFAKTPADKKAVRIVQHSQTLVWEPMSDELPTAGVHLYQRRAGSQCLFHQTDYRQGVACVWADRRNGEVAGSGGKHQSEFSLARLSRQNQI